jgi:hypothetical protein|nr:MAG TPA: hypothetical protein [Caudoviricetes sp.]
MKVFTIKRGEETVSVVKHGDNGKVLVAENNASVFVKSVSGFSYEVTDNEDKADVLINSDVEKIVWYIMGSIDKNSDFEVETEVIVTYK